MGLAVVGTDRRPARPAVSVVVAAFNQETVLPQLLDGLARQTWQGSLEVVIADNNSTDSTAQTAREFSDRIAGLTVFIANRGQGQCVARNDGVRRASGDLLLFIDGDDVPAPDWVQEMVSAAHHGDLVGGQLDVLELNTRSTVDRWPGSTRDCLASLESFPLHYATGTNFGIWRDVLEQVGPWDEKYRGGGEDAELCWRAQLGGYSLIAAKRAVVHYRLRHDLRDLLPQNYRYGLAVARLRRDFAGLRTSSTGTQERRRRRPLIARAVRETLTSADRRGRLLAKLAFQAGRLRGRCSYPEPMRWVHRAARVLAGPYRGWSVEVAMRYVPIVRLVEKFGSAADVTEIGSGGVGIVPYLRGPVLGVDQDFGDWSPAQLTRVRSSVLALPFADRSRPAIISVDMLEHVPPEVRRDAIDELVRISGRLLLLAVPSGAGAAAQDVLVGELYRRKNGENYPFLSEHVTYGLPSREEVDYSIKAAMIRHARTGRVSYVWNTNLRIREGVMRVWVNNSAIARAALVLANYLQPVLTRLNRGECYRLIAVVRFE